MFENIVDKNHPDDAVLTIIQGSGTLPRCESSRNIRYDEKGVANYKKVNMYDYIIHLRSFEGGLEMANSQGIISPAYTVLRSKKEFAPLFYSAYFHTDEFINHILAKSVEGIRDGRQISYEAFKWLPIPTCNIEEQRKIADLFRVLNDKIKAQQLLVDSLKKYKRGLHFFVFEKNRNESWGKKTLYEIATFCGGGTPSKDKKDYWSGKIGWISSSDLDEEWIDTISVSRYITKSAIDNSATKLCPKGTISIVSRVGVGKVAVMPENLCTSQDFINITSIDGDTKFFAYQIAYKMKIQATKTQGTSIKGVTSETLKAMVLDIPPLKEQIHISKMLLSVDKRLKVELNTLNKMQTIKNGMLQQLFI